MTVRVRALVFAIAGLVAAAVVVGQEAVGVVHVKVSLPDADQKPMPVPRHAILVSENPASATPRRYVTAADGTLDLKLKPGNYTIESDKPVTLQGKAYQWTRTLDVKAGANVAIDFDATNAEVEALSAAEAETSPATDPLFLQNKWQDSVFGIWTPKRRATGFVIEAGGDAKGLIVTNQRAIGTESAVELQVTPSVKVTATVLVADQIKDVAVLRVDPEATASVRPIPLDCAGAPGPAIAKGQEIVTLGAPLRQEKGLSFGEAEKVDEYRIAADFHLSSGGAGGPVFTSAGGVLGLTSIGDNENEDREGARVIRLAHVCAAVEAASARLKDIPAPPGTHLPVDSVQTIPPALLKKAIEGRAGRLSPYQFSSTEFDVALITPIQIFGVEEQERQMRDRRSGRSGQQEPPMARPLMEFGYWSGYVADLPPVLFVRVTPRFVEGFWTKVARGAAQTQGMAIPPIKRFKSGFQRMRAFCGDREVLPIHPFKLEQRIGDGDGINEGFYAFDPASLGPLCASVRFDLFSEKEPDKADSRTVDPALLQQVWQDFTAIDVLKAAGAGA